MGISVKSHYADEITEAMVNILNDGEFKQIHKTAGFTKEAGPALETFKQELAVSDDIDGVWTKHLPALQQEENLEPGVLQLAVDAKEARAKELGKPGYTVPRLADDEEMADDNFTVAADFAMDHMVKLADALDNRGFSVLASAVDETIEKISKYKTWKGKGEKPPKGAEEKAPKAWWDKMEKEVSKKNPDYSKKRVREIVGDIWDNELTDKKRKQILNRK